MKALVKLREGAGFVELRERGIPDVKPKEVRIKVMSAGVCGTDIKIWRGEAWSNPPVVLGHEYAGVVEAVGEDVEEYRIGDRVVSETAQVVCGSCEYCKTGRYLMCPRRLSIGYGVDGAFAEYISVREDILHRIPDAVSFDEAALCEPLAVALHGVWDSGTILPTDTVLVLGPGTIGQLAAQAAKAKGATVVLLGTRKDGERLATAEELGIDHCCFVDDSGRLDALIGERGADIAVDCTGTLPAIALAMKSLKRNGRLVQIGLTKPCLEIPYSLLTERELSIIGSFGHRYRNWEQAIALLSCGKVRVKSLITGHFDLGRWQEAFGLMEQQQGIKVLLHPN